MYLATVVDLVEMPKVQTAYGLKDRIRIHWILAHLNGTLYIGKDGQPVEAVWMGNANMGAKAELPKKLTQILGQAPPVITSTEQLEGLIIGRSNVLMLVATPNPKDPNNPFVNVDGIGPIQPGMPAAPAIPANYVRAKNRPKTVIGPNGQPVQTYATPAAAQSAAQTNAVAVAQPTPEQIAAFLAAQNKPAAAPVAAPAFAPPNSVNLGTPAAAVPQGVDPNAIRPTF